MVLLLLPWLRLLLLLQCLTFSSFARFPFHDSQVMLGCFSAPRALQERPRATPTTFFRFQESPRALQEALKRLFEGFRVEDATGNQFWTRF